MTVRFSGGAVRGEVKDWNSRLPQPCQAPADATTGRGLQLVEAIASSWGIEREADGKVVWFELHVPRSGPTKEAMGSDVSG